MPTKILYAILNWGLGHASRSIPVIELLLAQNIEVVIASDGEALLLIQEEFPKLETEKLAAYNVQYAAKAKDFDKTIFAQLPRLGAVIKKEHQQTQKLIQKHDITHIISDNRYGVYSKKIPSVVICHQLRLQHKSKLSQAIMNKVHFTLLDKFDAVWVPDFEAKNALAGTISSTKNIKLKAKTKYIGTLSRFEKLETEIKYDLCIVLSGPEPQRTLLETKLYTQAKQTQLKTALVRGISNANTTLKATENIKVFNLLNSKDLNTIILQSQNIVCRAGYSSIMDLVKLQKPALLIATPGQTEQEYLARFLAEKKFFKSVAQAKVNLAKDLKNIENKQQQENLSTKNLEKTLAEFLI